MSRVYWHAETREAELLGRERAWLNHLAEQPGAAAWDLRGGSRELDRAAAIIAMIPETYRDGRLRRELAEAQAEWERFSRAVDGRTGPDRWNVRFDRSPLDRLVSSLELALKGLMSELKLNVAGVELSAWSVTLNTAVAVGSDPIRLAARIHAQCEIHAFVEQDDREWLTEVIAEGRRTGLYRDGAGWEDVSALLLDESAPGPVVMSYSVCDSFPNASISGWMRAGWPEGRYPDDEGSQWPTYDTLTEDEKHAVDERGEAWYDLDDAEQWRMSIDALRANCPWARIQPKNFTRYHFGPAVTVYDLFAPDRDERVRRAAGLDVESVARGDAE